MHRSTKLAASLVCADMLNIGDEVGRVVAGGADYIHFDVMDGMFVPRYGLLPEMLVAVRRVSELPVDVHLMVQNPESYIDIFAKSGANIFAPHVEACPHLHRTVHLINDSGMTAGVALNPATPLDVLKYVLDDIGMVVLMAINPGIVGHKLIPGALEKIRELKAMIGDREILIEIDGGVTPESASHMISAGADVLVCGSSTIFRPQEEPVDIKLKDFRLLIERASVVKQEV